MIAGLAAAALAQACLDVSHQRDVPVAFTGRLERRAYPGPPNYGEGPDDRVEHVYILTLDRPICVDDGGDFGNSHDPFRELQLYTSSDGIWPRLRAVAGHRIRISGRGFAGMTGHHRTPLVVDVAEIADAPR